MAGVVTAGINLVAVADTEGFKKFSNGIRDMRLQFLGLDQAVQIVKQLSEALLAMGKFGAGAISATVKEAIELDDIMTQVVSIQTDLAPIVGELTDEFQRMANTLPLSATELGETAVQAARAGVNTKKGLAAIALASGKLAAITDSLTEANATQALVTISKIYKVTTEDMAASTEQLADTFARLEQVGIATAGAIARASTDAAGAAKAFNLTKNELLGLTTAAINTGASAGVAGTAISKLLLKIGSQSEKAAAAAGINADEFRNLIDSGEGIEAIKMFLGGLTTAADGSKRSTTEFNEAMRAAGVGGKKLGGLVQKLAGNMDFLTDAITASEDATGTLDTRFAIASQSMQKQIDTLVGSVSTIAAQFGATLKPIIVAVIQVLLFFGELLIRIPAPIKFLIVVVVALATASALLLGALLALLAGLAAVATGAIFMGKTLLSGAQFFKKMRDETNAATIALVAFRKAQRGLARTVPGTARHKARTGLRDRSFQNLNRTTRGGDFKRTALRLAESKLQLTNFIAASGGIGPAIAAGFSTAFASGGPIMSGLAAVGGFLTGPIAIGIGVVILAVIALKDDILDVIDAFLGLFDPVKEIFKRMSAFGQEAGTSFSLVGAFFGAIRLLLLPLVIGLKSFAIGFRLVTSFFMEMVDAVFDGLEPLIAVFKRFGLGISRAGDAIRKMAVALGIVSKEGSIMDSIMSGLGSLFRFMFKPIEFIVRGLAFAFEILLAVVGGVVEGVIRAFQPVFFELFALKQVFTEAFDEFALVFEPVVTAWRELMAELGLGTEGFDFFGVVVQGVSFLVRAAIQSIIVPIRLLIKVIGFLVKVFMVFAKPFIFMFQLIAAQIESTINMWKLAVKTFKELFPSTGGLSDSFKAFFIGLGDDFQEFMDFLFDGLQFLLDAMVDAFRSFVDPFGALNTLGVPGFADGGGTTTGGIANLHPNEGIIPFDKMPEVAARFAGMQPVNQRSQTANLTAGSSSPSSGGGTPVEINIPVTVMLEELVLGQAIVRVSEERIRQEFGTRGVRLAGI